MPRPKKIKEIKEEEIITDVKSVKSPESVFDIKYVSAENLELIKSCVELNQPCLLIGETGTGKTTLIKQCANDYGKKLTRVSVNGSMGTEEILGRYLVDKGSTYWQDGILTQACRNGDWIVLDEINSALPEILFALHQLLDDDRRMTLPEKDNEVVVPHAEFRFFASMNPPEEYAGTKDMNKALMSRFTAVIYVPVLDEVTELDMLVKAHKADGKVAEQLVRTASLLRKEKYADNIFYFCSTRDLVQTVVLMRSGISLANAFRGAVVNKMSLKEAEQVKSILSNITKISTVHPKTIDSIVQENSEFTKKIAELATECDKKIKTLTEGYEVNIKVRDDMIISQKKEIDDLKALPKASGSSTSSPLQAEILKKIGEAVRNK